MPALVSALADSLPRLALQRLIGLRWLSVFGMIGAALLSPNLLGTRSLLSPLLAVAACVACLNACLWLAEHLHRPGHTYFPGFSPVIQLALDLTGWASFIYLSGGATNPLISIFLPLVAIGAQILSPLPAWLFGAAAILAYSFLWHFYLPLPLSDALVATRLHLLGMWLVFAVSAVVVVWFVSRMTQAIRQRDAALAEAREKSLRSDWVVSLGSLAAGAAHEMSTPLATLTLLVDNLLEDYGHDPHLHEDLTAMQAQIAACKNSLTQLTCRAGHERGEHLSSRPTGEWLRHLIGAWHSQHPRAHLEISLAPDLDALVLPADIGLERAIHNLLDNALRAARHRVALHAERRDDTLRLRIGDDGPGLSPLAQECFTRGQPIPSREGMGIGLLLAKGALERLGGTLEFIAAPAGGTIAYLTLPIRPLANP